MFPPSAVILHRLPLCSNRSIRFTAGGTGQVWLCNSAAITRLTVSHNGLLLKAQFTQIAQKKTNLEYRAADTGSGLFWGLFFFFNKISSQKNDCRVVVHQKDPKSRL